MKTRLISCLLALVLVLGAAPAARAADTPYVDVPESNWAYEEIQLVTQWGLFNGVDSTHFGPKENMTRAQFVAALVRLFGWEEEIPETPTFSDCTEPQRWYYSAVETAYANGALPTYSTTFRPTDPITREEMATMLVRALGYTSLAGHLSATELPFTDITTNRGYIAVAYDLGLINGYEGGLYKPDQIATREQAAAILARLYSRYSATSYLAEEGYTPLRVDHPKASADTAIPTTPVEPFQDLYDTLKSWQTAGTQMSTVAVVLTDGGVATTTQGSRIVSTKSISQTEVEAYLDRSSTKVYYSDRDQCAYLVSTSGNTTVTVWYNDEASIAAKLLLCRLFGVDCYVLEEN